MSSSTIKSLVGVLLATTLGAGVAWAVSQWGTEVLGIPIVWLAVGGAYLIQWLVFIIAFILKSEKFFDLTGSLTYISITTMAVLAIPQVDDRTVLLLVLVIVWAARLGTFLFTRIMKQGRDDRFDEIKVDFGRFLLTWTLQGLWITFTAAAAWAAITSSIQKPLGWPSLLGLVIWAGGFFFEMVADAQKSAFKSDSDNEGKFIQSGLWAWSRHPNYFGEIVIWIGVAIIALPVLRGWSFIGLVSPIWVILQLTLISGIPMLEKKADQRWSDREDYQSYKQNTPVLIPRLPSKRQ